MENVFLEATANSGVTSGLSDLIDTFSNHVVPLLTKTPFNIFLGLMVFGAGCCVFRKLRRTV